MLQGARMACRPRTSSTKLDEAPPPPPAAGLCVEQGVHCPMRTRFLASLAQLQPPARDLDVDVGLSPSWQLLQHRVPSDQLGDRKVDRVVPAGGGFWQRDLPPFQAQEVLVAEDVLEELVIAP